MKNYFIGRSESGYLSIPRREEMITVTFAVVAFSVFVQGPTVVPLLRRLGELLPEEAHRAGPQTRTCWCQTVTREDERANSKSVRYMAANSRDQQ